MSWMSFLAWSLLHEKKEECPECDGYGKVTPKGDQMREGLKICSLCKGEKKVSKEESRKWYDKQLEK